MNTVDLIVHVIDVFKSVIHVLFVLYQTSQDRLEVFLDNRLTHKAPELGHLLLAFQTVAR